MKMQTTQHLPARVHAPVPLWLRHHARHPANRVRPPDPSVPQELDLAVDVHAVVGPEPVRIFPDEQ